MFAGLGVGVLAGGQELRGGVTDRTTHCACTG